MPKIADMLFLLSAKTATAGYNKPLQIADFLLLFATLDGLFMAALNYEKKIIPLILAIGHGLFVVAGLTLFVIAMMSANLGIYITVSFILLMVATLGGPVLIRYRIRKQPLPRAFVLVHGLIVILAFAIQTPYWR